MTSRAVVIVFGFLVLLGVAAARGCNADAATFNHRPVQREVTDGLENGHFGELADNAFDAMFTRAAHELRIRGHETEADDLIGEWEAHYKGLLSGRQMPEDTGDHFPLSEWVQTQYAKLEALLGVEVMDATHLRDIWVLNFTIPVVFAPHQDAEWCVEYVAEWDDGCEKELERHFAGTHWVRGADGDQGATAYRHSGFAGVVTYWAVLAACEAALWGTDGTLACGAASSLAQIAVERYVAPPVAARLWESRN